MITFNIKTAKPAWPKYDIIFSLSSIHIAANTTINKIPVILFTILILDEIKFSGKTGTSQVKAISIEERESEDFRKKELEWKNRDHALFVGYMPSKNPKFSISVVIEHGGSGASTAAPIAKQIFNYIHKLKIWF